MKGYGIIIALSLFYNLMFFYRLRCIEAVTTGSRHTKPVEQSKDYTRI